MAEAFIAIRLLPQVQNAADSLSFATLILRHIHFAATWRESWKRSKTRTTRRRCEVSR